MAKPLFRHSLALAAAFGAVLAVGAAWVANLRLGPPLEGVAAGAMVIVPPMVLLVLFALWLLVRAVLGRRVGWRPMTVGPVACFQFAINRYLGWFLIAGTTLSALAHHMVLIHLRRS